MVTLRRWSCLGCASLISIVSLTALFRPEFLPTAPRFGSTTGSAAFGVGHPDVRTAVVAAVEAIDGIDESLLKELYDLARSDVLKILGRETRSCNNWRKTSTGECVDPSQCGKGWLYWQKDLLLAVVYTPGSDNAAVAAPPPNNGAAEWGTADDWVPPKGWGKGAHQWQAGTSGMVNVVGLKEGGRGTLADCNSQDLSILIRLQGPEALAEAAIPVKGRCAWTVQFLPALEGVYSLDVTLLDWKGGLEVHRSKCNDVPGRYGEGSVELDSIIGGPFYGNFEACCTLCTRTDGCVGWSATNEPTKALVDGKRCVLYSSVVGKPVDEELLKDVVHSGTPRNEESMMYLGPSMSIARRWCAQENGNVYVGHGGLFAVTAASQASNETREEGTQPGSEAGAAELPLCGSSSSTRRLPEPGRWVSLRDTKCNLDAKMMDSTGWPKFIENVVGKTMTEACFLKPVLDSSAGSLKYANGGYVWQPYDCRYDLIKSEARLDCFREKNVTRFLDFGDSLISTSRAPRSALWLPTATSSEWSTGTGRKQIGEGAEEAGCVGGSVQYYGEASHQHQDADQGSPRNTTTTNRYCGVESYYQVPAGQVRNLVSSFKPDVVLANWALVHRLWHHTLDEFKVFLGKLGNQLDDMAQNDGHRPRYMFWLSAPYMVSEREPHCVLERGLQYNEALRRLLQPRGWIEIDWVTMTRKWGLDILDGAGSDTEWARVWMKPHRIPYLDSGKASVMSAERLRRSWFLIGCISALLQDVVAWWSRGAPPELEEPAPFNLTFLVGEEAGMEWLEGADARGYDSISTLEDYRKPEGRRNAAVPPRWDSSDCMASWGVPELQTEGDPGGYVVFSEGREQLGNNRFLLSDGLVIAKVLNRTLVEFPMRDSRIATVDAELGSCDYWDCESLCSYHRILDLWTFRSMLRKGVVRVDEFFTVLFADKEQALLRSLISPENITDFFLVYNNWQVIEMKMAWKSALRREPIDLLRPNPFYLDLVGSLIDAQEGWEGGHFMAVQWRTETATGNLTECFQNYVFSAVEEQRLALGFGRHQVFFNTDLVGQASTTYNATVVYAYQGVVETIRQTYPLAMDNTVYDCLATQEDAGVKAMISGLVSASAEFLLSSSFNGSGSSACQKPHSKYIDLIAEWRLDVIGKNRTSIGQMLLVPAETGLQSLQLTLLVVALSTLVTLAIVWVRRGDLGDRPRSKKVP